jgi:hypothetical protein
MELIAPQFPQEQRKDSLPGTEEDDILWIRTRDSQVGLKAKTSRQKQTEKEPAKGQGWRRLNA